MIRQILQGLRIAKTRQIVRAGAVNLRQLAPVSYTHLPFVRQYWLAERKHSAERFQPLYSPPGVDAKRQPADDAGALDVYKRQRQEADALMRTMVNRQPQDAERVYASGLYLSGNDQDCLLYTSRCV